MSTSGLFFSVSLLSTFLAMSAAAQSTFGSITGTVTDPSGARVAHAQITITNQETGVTRKATAAGDGVYAVPDLQPGIYHVRVESGGCGISTLL